MGQNQGGGCCGGANKLETNLEHAAKRSEQTLKSSNSSKEQNNKNIENRKAFYKRQSTSLNIVGSMGLDSSDSSFDAFYGNLIISCTGKSPCNSKFSKLILEIQQEYQYGEATKKQNELKADEKRIICGQFRTKSETLRRYFIALLQNTENDEKYTKLYENLNDESYKIRDKEATFIYNELAKMAEFDEYLLQCLSNITCTFGSRPLWNEILENAEDNDDLQENAILDRVEEVHKSQFYVDLKSKGIGLTDNEILSVYIYTVNTEFADTMQKSLKIPCKWKQTFYYFVRGILKIYDAMVYKQKLNKLPQKLYHPVFGQSKVSAPLSVLSPINCTAKESVAQHIAPPDGMMYVFENVASALSKGKLIAAPIHWVSHTPEEAEWIIFPCRILKIKSTKMFESSKNSKQISVTKYETFNAALYGVDVFGKLAHLDFVQEILSNKV